ncbi:hypothetical protein D6764_00145, partial [Candidatus Woesearchaeota archaeon]
LLRHINTVYLIIAGILIGAGVFVALTRFIVPEIDRREKERLEKESYEINKLLDIIDESKTGLTVLKAAQRMHRPLKEVMEIAEFLEGEGIVEEADNKITLTSYGRKIRQESKNFEAR